MTPAIGFVGWSCRRSTTDFKVWILTISRMMDTTLLRVAEVADAEAIALLSTELGYPTDPKIMAERLSRILLNPGHHLIVAVQAPSEITGWIHGFLTTLVESDDRVEIGGLIVAQKFQRRGIGSRLVRRLQQWGQSHGAFEMSVRCQVKRAEAHRFYEALGFQVTKTQHVFRQRLSPSQP